LGNRPALIGWCALIVMIDRDDDKMIAGCVNEDWLGNNERFIPDACVELCFRRDRSGARLFRFRHSGPTAECNAEPCQRLGAFHRHCAGGIAVAGQAHMAGGVSGEFCDQRFCLGVQLRYADARHPRGARGGRDLIGAAGSCADQKIRRHTEFIDRGSRHPAVHAAWRSVKLSGRANRRHYRDVSGRDDRRDANSLSLVFFGGPATRWECWCLRRSS